MRDSASPATEMLRLEVDVSSDDAGIGTTTTPTCPDRSGSLVDPPDQRTTYRRLVGHVWAADALSDSRDGGRWEATGA
jgi:hypothetical protein